MPVAAYSEDNNIGIEECGMANKHNHPTVSPKGSHPLALRFWRSVGVGFFCGILAVVILLLLAAWLIAKFHIPATALNGICVGLVLLGGLINGLLSGRMMQEKGLLIGLISGLIWIVLLVVGHLAFVQDGLLTDSLWIAIKAAGSFVCCIVGSLLGVVLAMKKQNRRYSYG